MAALNRQITLSGYTGYTAVSFCVLWSKFRVYCNTESSTQGTFCKYCNIENSRRRHHRHRRGRFKIYQALTRIQRMLLPTLGAYCDFSRKITIITMERTNKNRIVVVVILCRKNCDFFAKSPIVNYHWYYGRNKHLSERETQKHYGKGKLKSHCCG
jgi:hypothetical protein